MRLNTVSNILTTQGNFTVSYNKATLLLLGFILLLGFAGWGGYRYAHWKQDDAYGHKANLILSYPESTQSINSFDEHHLQALIAHMGRIEANLMRVNALGERIVAIARLDPQEFNFNQDVPMGGPLVNPDNRRLLQAMKELDEILTKRYTQLSALLFTLQLKKGHKEISLYGMGNPVTDGWISSFFGTRIDPITGHKAWHAGVDIAGKEGAEVKALAGGVVSFASKSGGYGHLVEIKHADGLSTRYGHNKTLLVQPGEWVKKGQTIALLGSSGRSTGPHVHLEVLQYGEAVDPGKFFPDLKK
ncbi:MAG: M23 family metallopeptidase [Proteobacteria bacterium]|nr:M23 family metallopeptidase [Pseudomonadota bacterium]